MMRGETRMKLPITNNDAFIENNVSCSLHRKTRTQLTTGKKKKNQILLAFLPFNKIKINHQESLCFLSVFPTFKNASQK